MLWQIAPAGLSGDRKNMTNTVKIYMDAPFQRLELKKLGSSLNEDGVGWHRLVVYLSRGASMLRLAGIPSATEIRV